MKYVVIVAIIVLFVRIDFWLGLFERAGEDISESTEISSVDINSDTQTIPVAQDIYLKQSTRETFLALLEDFRTAPTTAVREKALGVLKETPNMFNQKLDKELESQIFRWRDLLNNNEPEVVNFLVDLLNVLQGENQLMIKKFFSLWMEIDMEKFIKAYARTKDTNCLIATTIGDNIPEEEKINEYYEREDALKAFVAKEKVDPIFTALANNCLMVLGIQISKMTTGSIAVPDTQVVSP